MFLLTGFTGFIASHIPPHLHALGVPLSHLVTPTRRDLDLAQPDNLASALDRVRPSAIIHCAAMRDLMHCEREPELAITVNVHATAALARWCAASRARLIYLSTDQVFAGDRGMYCEDDPRRPINHYGVTKALGEDATRVAPQHTVARIALTLGHTRERTRSPNEFITTNLRAGKHATLFENEFRTPVLVTDAARALAELATMPSPPPTLHVGGPERLNRVEMGLAIARAFALDERLCLATRHQPKATGLQRPLDTSMDTYQIREQLRQPPRSFAESVRYLAETEPTALPSA
jgi:dTDP-4-dehydrorhamnose reductase